ncbi:MAG: RNA 2',3'-cyclic phosphodiesterase [Alphaproteobacteria bacterium]|nr:RNA 2',3'-cyclic phosphodiesterase [Alphaproteobacteria bacterium]
MRLFVAVELPDDIKDRLSHLCAGLRGAKWSDPEQMHLTLHFIGDVDGVTAHDLALALSQVRAPQFDVALAGLGDFTTRGRVSTLWVGVRANPDLAALHARIESAVRRVGIPPEPRKFHPHVTLARFATGRGDPTPALGRYLAEHEPFSTAPFTAEEFTLFSSVLGSEGATHIPETAYPLQLPPRPPSAGEGRGEGG